MKKSFPSAASADKELHCNKLNAVFGVSDCGEDLPEICQYINNICTSLLPECQLVKGVCMPSEICTEFGGYCYHNVELDVFCELHETAEESYYELDESK